LKLSRRRRDRSAISKGTAKGSWLRKVLSWFGQWVGSGLPSVNTIGLV
jgi:hypothetical protein